MQFFSFFHNPIAFSAINTFRRYEPMSYMYFDMFFMISLLRICWGPMTFMENDHNISPRIIIPPITINVIAVTGFRPRSNLLSAALMPGELWTTWPQKDKTEICVFFSIFFFNMAWFGICFNWIWTMSNKCNLPKLYQFSRAFYLIFKPQKVGNWRGTCPEVWFTTIAAGSKPLAKQWWSLGWYDHGTKADQLEWYVVTHFGEIKHIIHMSLYIEMYI